MALERRPFDAFDRVMGNGILVEEIFESDAGEATRCRIVLLPKPWRPSLSRQAMIFRETVRNPAGCGGF